MSQMQAVVENTTREELLTTWRVLTRFLEASNELTGDDWRVVVGAQRYIANVLVAKQAFDQ